MSDNFGELTRREFLGYLAGVAGSSVLLASPVLAQDVPIPISPTSKVDYKKDLNTPQAAVDTFYHAVQAGDIEGINDLVADRFWFVTQKHDRKLDDEVRKLACFLFPGEMHFGSEVVQRRLSQNYYDPSKRLPSLGSSPHYEANIFHTILHPEEKRKMKEFGETDESIAEIENPPFDKARAHIVIPYEIADSRCVFMRYTIQLYTGLQQKESKWKFEGVPAIGLLGLR